MDIYSLFHTSISNVHYLTACYFQIHYPILINFKENFNINAGTNTEYFK